MGPSQLKNVEVEVVELEDVSSRAMKPRKKLPSEKTTPRRLINHNVDPVSTLRILEYFEHNIAPTYKLSRSADGWRRLLGHFRNKHAESTARQQWNLLPRHIGDPTSDSPLDIEFLYRKNIDIHVCDFSADKARTSIEHMTDFERICRQKPDDVSLRWIHVPIGLGMFQSTLEDIFLHCDPEEVERPNTFVRSGLPRWPYPEVNMMTFINREDHQDRLEAIRKLSAMSKFGNLSPVDGLCDTVSKDLEWRSKILNKKLGFWDTVNSDFPTPVSEKICLRQDIGPLSGRATSMDFGKQALSKHDQFANASLVLSKLRAFNRADGFLLTFANTSGIDYLTKDFEKLINSPGYDMLYHRDASVIAHTMHAFQHSGTRRWDCTCNESAAIWLVVYLFTEAAVTPHNIRGGRSAVEILDAYMEALTIGLMTGHAISGMLSRRRADTKKNEIANELQKRRKDMPWALGQSPILVRAYQQYMEEIKTVESITSDNLRVLENIQLDIQGFEGVKCDHPQCETDANTRISNDTEGNARWKPESMTQRLEWAIALLKEREADLRRMESHFDKALKNLLDICIIEQNDRSVVADTMNKAILLFTGITVVFLPLSFITSLVLEISRVDRPSHQRSFDPVYFEDTIEVAVDTFHEEAGHVNATTSPLPFEIGSNGSTCSFIILRYRRWPLALPFTYLVIAPTPNRVDLVPLYPHSLWVPANAPLHFLSELREYYIATYNDQFFLPPPAKVPSFFALFAFFELIFHLPISLWAVRALWASPLNGKSELLLLVYGVETALTTLTCMYDAALWDPAVVTAAQKTVLIGGLYGGYFALAVLLTIDMYARVLKRVNAADAAKKVQ
ncbi:hypothetical protein O1611_g8192 [Lasiodiplodia mahajangana]|uniref:Uncharacterized protein n=1 Tax=Lasiodiplodia mahajangana TaxID=1108764 RepID=A0ACC2JDH9_9PEZI|nr:hypothetical protein O1611_g8192 [Lasiodiplodia mahajangana]